MKNNSFSALLLNPFARIAGWKAFFIGIMIVCVTVVVGYLANVHFPGALDAKVSPYITLKSAFLVQGIGLLSLVIVMFIVGLLFSKTVRFQDVLGTIVLSRYPMLLLALLGFVVDVSSLDSLMGVIFRQEPFVFSDFIGLAVFSLLSIPIIIWQLVLMYNAFSVSTGLKGGKGILLYVGAVFVAELVSLIAIYFSLKLFTV